jgi:hypothetical protein
MPSGVSTVRHERRGRAGQATDRAGHWGSMVETIFNALF